MHHPNLLGYLHRVNHAKSITLNASAISNTPEPRPIIDLAMSGFPPSAAIVSAVRHILLASSGNVANALWAAFTHETGRVFRVIAGSYSSMNMLSYLTTYFNSAV